MDGGAVGVRWACCGRAVGVLGRCGDVCRAARCCQVGRRGTDPARPVRWLTFWRPSASVPMVPVMGVDAARAAGQRVKPRRQTPWGARE